MTKKSNTGVLWFLAFVLLLTVGLSIVIDTGIGVKVALALIAGFFIQNAVFTMVSRSRNSGHVWYHFPIAIMSNGIYFLLHYVFIIPEVIKQVNAGDTSSMLWLALLYTLPTASGSTFMMWFAVNKIEKGKKRVGGNSINKLEEELKELRDEFNAYKSK